MTAFNSALFIAEAIESVLGQQTTLSWELLLIDDGSTDDTLAIATEYAHRHPTKIHLLQHKGGVNCGISASRNLGLRHARGPLLTFLDSDDVWLPHCLETQANLLKRLPEITMVYAAAERWVDFETPFDAAASRNARWGCNYLPPLLPGGQRAGRLPSEELLDWMKLDESMVPCICTVMLYTETARAVGGFCDEFRGLYDDQAFHAKVIRQCTVYANDQCLARYRQHAASCCAQARADQVIRSREKHRLNAYLLELSGTLDRPRDRRCSSGTHLS